METVEIDLPNERRVIFVFEVLGKDHFSKLSYVPNSETSSFLFVTNQLLILLCLEIRKLLL